MARRQASATAVAKTGNNRPPAPPRETDEPLNRLASLAARTLGTPICLISLITPEQQLVEGLFHPPARPVSRVLDMVETPCRQVHREGAPLVIRDLREDPAWRGKPVAAMLEIGGYIGVPLAGHDGTPIGALCAVDHQPRDWSAEDIRTLSDFAILASGQLRLQAQIAELDQLHRERDREGQRFDLALSHVAHGLCFFGPDDRLEVFNRQYAEIYRVQPEDIRAGMTVAEILRLRSRVATDPDLTLEAYEEWRSRFRDNPRQAQLLPLKDGRTIRVFMSRTVDGGWVATHEDVTAQLQAEARRREQESQYKLLATYSGDVIILRERSGKRLYCSPAIASLAGYEVEEAMLTPISEWVHPDDLPLLQQALDGLCPERPRSSVVHRFRHKQGHFFWVEGTLALVDQAGGEPRIVCNIRDVTRRKKAESEYRDLFEHSIVGIYRKTLDHRLVRVNPALVAMAGFGSAEQLVASGFGGWYVEPGRHDEIIRMLARDGHVRDLQSPVISPRTGEIMWISETAWVVTAEEDMPLYIEGMVVDITASVASQFRMRELAERDQLTGLPNRGALRDALDRAMTAGRAREIYPALVYLDLDRFKSVNDSYGHAAGDELLVQISRRIVEVVGDQGLVARMGGDEFAILLTRPEQIANVDSLAIRLIATINQVVQLSSGQRASVGASLGITAGQAEDTDIDAIKRRADMAMYQAKRDGRNAFRHYSNSLEAQLNMRQQIELGLREAIAKDQFEVYFQPILDLGLQRLSGFEALVRWRQADGTMVSPASFIPIAEENGLIVPIGEIVTRQAIQEAASWPESLRVAINASVVQLKHPDFVGTLMAAMTRAGLPPERIEIEVTESALLDDSPTTLAVLQKLQMLGVRVALDDFGTGWSSLSYLNRHRFDRIKIDRSFVKGISDRRNEAIIRAVTDLGNRIGTDITAEGVETETQLKLLRQIGCHEVQGFLFGKPMPAAQALDFARNRVVVEQPARHRLGLR